MKAFRFFPFLFLCTLLSCSSDDKSNKENPENPAKGTSIYTVPEKLSEYYSEVNFSEEGKELKEEIATLTIGKHSTFLEYWQRHNYLYYADEDPSNPKNVILIYSGESRDAREYWSTSNDHEPQTFNTEHVYPRSFLTSSAEADLHNLRTADAEINESRSNFPYVDGEGNYKVINHKSFYPGNEWRGDVARIIMYMNIRYDESFETMGGIDLFLEWNAEDPVSFLETQRNQVFHSAQGNRNPFIDNPHLATKIWGGKEAENLWENNPEPETDVAELFFSEYIEGSEFNKVLEIVNLTGATVDLSNYSIKKQVNGEGEWGNEYELSGELSNEEVYVLMNSRASLEKILAEADISIGAPLDFNGNDPVGLFKNGNLIDIIGIPGGEDFAKDVTLRRKATITSANSTYDPEEWEIFEENTVEDLGEY